MIPAAFPEWEKVCDRWGGLMMGAIFEISKLAALGFGLPENTFYDMLQYGPHLLAPTGSDLASYGKKDTVFAGFHTGIYLYFPFFLS